MKNPQIYINGELENVTLTEAFDMIQESTDWTDYDTKVYEDIVEALDLEFDFSDTEADWEGFWNNEVVPAVEKIKDDNAKELLEEIKSNDVSYAIVRKNGEIYCNLDTQNIMDVYGYTYDSGEHFYGVYGDAIDGQLDSRGVSDEVILKAIKLMLSLGRPVKRDELPTKEGFKPAFVLGYPEACELMEKFGLIREPKENPKVKEWLETHKDAVGSTVKHPYFGKGKVVKVEDLIIVVKFEERGETRLALEAIAENNNLLEF